MTFLLVALGALFIVYGLISFSAAAGTWFFLVWFALGALSFGCAWAEHSGRWNSLPHFGKRATEIIVGAVLVCLLATQAFIMRDFNDTSENGMDYLIVLGARVSEGQMSATLQNRLDAAFDYLTNNPDTQCIVTGGKTSNELPSEADVMFNYLVERGIDPARIMRDDKAMNTTENITNCKELIDDPAARSVVITTSDYHLFRSLNIARKAGFANVHGLATESSRLYLPNNLIRESLAIVKDFAMGHL